MPLVLTPANSSTPGPVTGDDLIVVGPVEAINAYHCPVLMKTRTVITDRGQEATIDWQLRDRSGKAVDITNVLDEGGQVVVRIVDALGCERTVYTIDDVTAIQANAGQIRFELPSEVAALANIYHMQLAVYDENEKVLFTDKGLLSVEPGLFVEPDADLVGPITIGELRIRLRDTLTENDLTDRVEFDDTEVIASIIDPLMYWNEIPPPVGSLTPRTFPWKYHWMRGTIAQLLRIAAAWYMRNRMKIDHGGTQDDDRNKYQEYLALSQLYDREWKEFVEGKKNEINLSRCFWSIS